ncbi:MAG: hypothetical protein FZCXV1_gp2 [Hangzhou zicrona caerulea xinmovirus 1]|uniref:Uncharacterized protein n=1 Tax=Hangzhou zicrona caerulea xinmovirus 1 TaxID=2905557 RepID=A0A8K1XCE8_9MONO|nr:MAG: hypothetical protein FZCXV1_gp2 [Hangzhou zicrona caerulea xinmovirus 1]
MPFTSRPCSRNPGSKATPPLSRMGGPDKPFKSVKSRPNEGIFNAEMKRVNDAIDPDELSLVRATLDTVKYEQAKEAYQACPDKLPFKDFVKLYIQERVRKDQEKLAKSRTTAGEGLSKSKPPVTSAEEGEPMEQDEGEDPATNSPAPEEQTEPGDEVFSDEGGDVEEATREEKEREFREKYPNLPHARCPYGIFLWTLRPKYINDTILHHPECCPSNWGELMLGDPIKAWEELNDTFTEYYNKSWGEAGISVGEPSPLGVNQLSYYDLKLSLVKAVEDAAKSNTGDRGPLEEPTPRCGSSFGITSLFSQLASIVKTLDSSASALASGVVKITGKEVTTPASVPTAGPSLSGRLEPITVQPSTSGSGGPKKKRKELILG